MVYSTRTIVLVLVGLNLVSRVVSFAPLRLQPFATISSSSTTSSSSRTAIQLSAVAKLISPDYQDYGNRCIYHAALQVGAKGDQFEVQWMPGRIIITVQGDVVVVSDNDDDDEDDALDSLEEEDDDIESGSTEEDADEETEADDEFSFGDSPSSTATTAIDLAALARAVNARLDDGDGPGAHIAATHEIEITTPGASDELHNLSPRQLNSYKGFDVSVVYMDAKTKAIKTIQGRLVGRQDEVTTINIKGRMKKLISADIESIKLPKAKRE